MKTSLLIGLSAMFWRSPSPPTSTGEPKFQYPLIKDHGGIVVLPDAAHQPKQNSKVLLDIISDKKSGKVITGFDRAALILNQYTQANAGIDNGLKMAIILHGPATIAALGDEGYAKHTQPYAKAQGASKNPNLELIRQLKKAGVEVYVCGQALAHHGYGTEEVAPGSDGRRVSGHGQHQPANGRLRPNLI